MKFDICIRLLILNLRLFLSYRERVFSEEVIMIAKCLKDYGMSF